MSVALTNTTEDNRSKYVALAGTLFINGVIILILFLIVIHTPIPPFPESGSPGFEVNFGYTDEGMGDVRTESQEAASSAAAKASVKAPIKTTAEKSEEPVLTSNNEETVALNQTKASTSEKPVPQQQVSTQLLNALKKLKQKRENGSDGNTNTPGNQGDINGTNSSTNYAGSPGNGNEPGDGTGKGTHWSLKGRKMLLKPELVDDSQETGTVVVEITVDKTGTVTYANPGARGSTTNNAVLYAKARQAAKQAKFNPSPDGIEEQRGTITFHFIFN